MALLLFFSLNFALAVALTSYELTDSNRLPAPLSFLNCTVCALVAGACFVGYDWQFLLGLAVSASSWWHSRRWLPSWSSTGRLLLVNHALLTVFGVFWGIGYIAQLPISGLTKVLMTGGDLLLILTLPVGLVQALETWEVLCRRKWPRLGRALPLGERTFYPKVCLQVPTYAEPSDLVIATLDALAQLRYPNFEVMVIDNNTKDPTLWQPVEEHCRRLGEHFRFFHVDPLLGAKAGALNFALRHASADVEIVAVVDADYQADPEFLADLVGYFDDPRLGFVQTPHDYRDWEHSYYQRMCYWEYKMFFATKMVALNERDAALTVGTMCLIRRRVLEEVGGWAEWCQTEDSELSIRIHAAGYSSVYVPKTYGRGLIPETFDGYKRQRFRWTCGPVQELKHHLRLYLPGSFGKTSALSAQQKLHHFNHGMSHFGSALGLFLTPIGLGVIVSMLAQGESLSLPLPLLVAIVISQLGNWVLILLIYRHVMACSLQDTIGAIIAKQALGHTIMTASVWGLFTKRLPWWRTNKFKEGPLGFAAVKSAQIELLLGIFIFSFGMVVLLAHLQWGLLTVIVMGIFWQSLGYLSAPVVALFAENERLSNN